MHLFLFTNTAQRELFQYVRREYATANKFPCIIIPWNQVSEKDGTKLALRFFFRVFDTDP